MKVWVKISLYLNFRQRFFLKFKPKKGKEIGHTTFECLLVIFMLIDEVCCEKSLNKVTYLESC